jgi:hypothetical protein
MIFRLETLVIRLTKRILLCSTSDDPHPELRHPMSTRQFVKASKNVDPVRRWLLSPHIIYICICKNIYMYKYVYIYMYGGFLNMENMEI